MSQQNSKKAKAAKAKRKASAAKADPEKDAEALAERERKRAEKNDRQRVRKRNEKIKRYAMYAAVVIFVVGGLTFIVKSRPEVDGVERPNDDGRGHVANATYDSSTPTSGPHRANSPNCGVYSTDLPLDLAVHALEHGVVVLWFDAAQPELAIPLEAIAGEWDSHVIVAPNTELDSAIVATAWNRRMSFDSVTETVREFVDAYRKRGPESVRCDF